MTTKDNSKELKQVLGFWDLMSTAVGQIIGAGIMSLTGIAIAMTGKSVPIAFLLSTIFVIAQVLPYIFINSTVRIPGGAYGIISLLASPKLGGFYVLVNIVGQMTLASYCLSAADYLMGLIGMGNRMIISLIILTLFYILNLNGIDKFSKIQNLVVSLLVIALLLFTFFGIGKVDWESFSVSSDWMTNGLQGLLQASTILTFATGGAFVIVNLSSESKNPTKDIPLVMIISTLGVAFLYAFMSIVAVGVLPLSQTAGQSLVNTAKAILPTPVFVYFIIGGALCALISTLNSQLAGATKPILQATWDGWFPESWGKLNSKKVPYFYLTVLYVIGVITILTGMNIGLITQLVLILASVNNIILVYSLTQLPKKLPEEWAASKFHISPVALMICSILGLASVLLNLYLQANGKPLYVLIGNIVFMVLALSYSFIRFNSGKVRREATYSRT